MDGGSAGAALLPSPGPTRLPRGDVAESQRRRLLRAMVDTVARRTYAATTIADVVAEAGVSRRTFYEHFDARLSCLLACLDEGDRLLLSALTDPSLTGLPPWPRLEATIGVYLDLLQRDPAFAVVYLVESYAAGAESIARRYASLRRSVALLASWHKELVREGLVPAHRVDWELVGCAISSVVTMAIATWPGDSLPALRPRLVEFIESAMGVTEHLGGQQKTPNAGDEPTWTSNQPSDGAKQEDKAR